MACLATGLSIFHSFLDVRKRTNTGPFFVQVSARARSARKASTDSFSPRASLLKRANASGCCDRESRDAERLGVCHDDAHASTSSSVSRSARRCVP